MSGSFLTYGAGLIAALVLFIGFTYLLTPARAVTSFGLKLPSLDANTMPWLRLKGIRDITLGLLVLALLFTASKHVVGTTLLVAAIVPFGDMATILTSGGEKAKAFGIHGFTCALLLIVGFLLWRSA